ncbi:hypothetical protein GGR40_000381 [Novosphingobium gossypii]
MLERRVDPRFLRNVDGEQPEMVPFIWRGLTPAFGFGIGGGQFVDNEGRLALVQNTFISQNLDDASDRECGGLLHVSPRAGCDDCTMTEAGAASSRLGGGMAR